MVPGPLGPEGERLQAAPDAHGRRVRRDDAPRRARRPRPLTLALSAGLLGMHLPGVGTVAVSQSIEYLKPVHIGDTITTTVEVTALDPERNRATLAVRWANQ